MAEEKIVMTREGMDKLEKEYRHLIDIDRPEVIEALTLARSQGDLSENADYTAARDRQGQIEARITEIEHIKDVAVIASEAKAGKKISLGNIVTYKDNDGENIVKIVGTIEADPFASPYPLISNESPLGMALLGKTPGEHIVVESDEPYEIDIIKAEAVK
ncbi:MAG: transcription elongation factor GreA [Bacilli bacterium]|jgi:transcription elongation factor GreA|nr:transcription elongation factor GreA [Bacilli bacterium]MCH4210329.1 transcription elongation factor GreA [Bacilli bacterium]MCH4228914.1 transcription elongation factor GreA [Bacilli bacterium]MCH4278103.1 transcription elongation factor GreA [Bacilli bacterium]MCI2055421.1 transcription elongation factor GreA [Bacilli bacterium]